MGDQQPETPRASWQILLSEIIQDAAVLEALSNEIGFNKVSLVRWGRGVVPNNIQTLQRLVDSRSFPPQRRHHFVEAVRKSFPDFHTEPNPLLEEGPAKEIPSLFYSQVLRSYAFVPDDLVFWTMTQILCHQLFGHIDAAESARVSALLLVCTPPASPDRSNVVRSFYIPVRQISERPSPLQPSFPIFVGTESPLTDISPTYNRPLIFNEQEIATLSTPFPAEVKSLALLPIQRRGKIAGTLLVSSEENNYFTQATKLVLYEYVTLLALAFRDSDFYSMQQLKFDIFPSLAQQQEQEAFTPYRRRVEILRRLLGSSDALSPSQEQLEILALQELENHLLQWRHYDEREHLFDQS